MWKPILISDCGFNKLPTKSVAYNNTDLWHNGKVSACQCRGHKRHQLDLWIGSIAWSRKWQPTPVCLPGKSHGHMNLVGYNPWGHKELNMSECAHTNTEVRSPKRSGKTELLLEVLGESPFTCIFHFVEIESIRCLMVHFTLISASSFILSPLTLIMLFHYCTLLKGPSWLHWNHSENPEQ